MNTAASSSPRSSPYPSFSQVDRSAHELLVVNDDPAQRYATSRLLRAAGFRVKEAQTGQEALDMADAKTSTVLLDVHLPDIDGFTVCDMLRRREDTARVPVIHISAAYIKDEDKVRGLDSGADAYLTHPVEPAVLVATVQSLIRTRVAEEGMRRSEAKFKAIYERAPGGIGLLDREGRLADANPALLRLLGRPAREAVGRRLVSFIASSHQAAAAEFVSNAEGRADWQLLPVVLPQGSVRLMEWSASPHAEEGVTMVLAEDASERIAKEEERERRIDQERDARGSAEHLSRMKDEFIAVLSHELRTPLNAIQGWVHVIRKRRNDGPTFERGLDAIERNIRLQTTLVSDLLDMSRLNMGKTQLVFQDVDVVECVEATVVAARSAAGATPHEIVVEVRGLVPLIRADTERLTQVFSNLLSNAMKFSPPEMPVRVEIAAQDAGVLVRVVDLGQGIDGSFLPYLFDRFSQADNPSNRRQGGLGLGLSIVRHLVEAHDGSIQAFSEGLGKGATFEVWLPVEGRRDTVPGNQLADDQDAPLSPLRLLVVDDDPEACALLQVILGDRGATVRTANDYEAALAALDEQAFDVLVSDVGMPGRDGYELIREVRRREAHDPARRFLPAIALTSFSRERDKTQAREAGFDMHCSKPLRPLEVIAAIQRLARTQRGA